MRMFMLVALFLLSFPTMLSVKTIREPQIAELAKRSFSSAVSEYDIPGLVVGVTIQGQHYFYVTGLSSLEDSIVVSPDTIFELGSISKIFNASLAALIEQRGYLDLNSPVSGQLPSLQNSAFDNIRLMDLATHSTGGLPLQVPNSVQDVARLIDWLIEWQPPQKGSRSYSNIGIGLLGHITAKALNLSYADALEGVLLPEMGLKSTWIDVPADAMNRYAFGYKRKTDAPIRVEPGVLDEEAYGVKSTARDMLRLLDIELGQANITPELKAAIERTQQGQTETAFYVQSMIWEQYPWPVSLEQMMNGNSYDFILKPQPMELIDSPMPPLQDVILNKTGSTNGFGSYIAFLPSENLGVVVLANRNYPNQVRVRSTYDFIKNLLALED